MGYIIYPLLICYIAMENEPFVVLIFPLVFLENNGKTMEKTTGKWANHGENLWENGDLPCGKVTDSNSFLWNIHLEWG